MAIMELSSIPPDLNPLKVKLRENAILSGKERRFIYELIEYFESSGRQFKRKLNSDGSTPGTKCKKVQVDADNFKQVHTISSQTANSGESFSDSGEEQNQSSSARSGVSNGSSTKESTALNLLNDSTNKESGSISDIPDHGLNLTSESSSDASGNPKVRKSSLSSRASKQFTPKKTVTFESGRKMRARKAKMTVSDVDVTSIESSNSDDRSWRGASETMASSENDAKAAKSTRRSSSRKSARSSKSDISPSPKKPYIEKLIPNKNNPGTSKDNILQSKQLAKQEKVDPAKARKLMDEGFEARRIYILAESPVVAIVKERYPLLFSRAETINEFDRITNDGRCDDFMKNIAGYSESILGMQREDDTLLLRTLKMANQAVTLENKLYALEVGALLMISPLVENRLEKTRSYLHLSDFEVTSEDTRYPYIKTQATFNDLFYNKHNFSIYVEDILLCEVSDFREAILCLVASYYIFNISYYPSNRNTLVFMEKVFLEAHETCPDRDEDRNLLQHFQTVVLKKRSKYKLPQLHQK